MDGLGSGTPPVIGFILDVVYRTYSCAMKNAVMLCVCVSECVCMGRGEGVGVLYSCSTVANGRWKHTVYSTVQPPTLVA